jgi:hypothetical protein
VLIVVAPWGKTFSFPSPRSSRGEGGPKGRMRGIAELGKAPHPSAALTPSPREERGEGK